MFTDTAASKVTAAHLASDGAALRPPVHPQAGPAQHRVRRSANTTCAAARSRWAGPTSQITVIDIDQGQSGASAADREGFQHLVAEVSLGRAGIVLGLECSRLARNSADWHQLLELCAMTGTLICDEDGLYDPRNFNDRLLLGMKGQMSRSRTAFHPGPAARRDPVQGPPRRAGHCRCRSGWSTTAPATSCSTPTPPSARAVRTCSPPSTPPGRPPPCVKAFRAAGLTLPLAAPHRAPQGRDSTGSRCGTTPCCGSCTTPAMPARSPTAATAARPSPAGNRRPPLLPRERMDRLHPRRPPRLHHPGPVRRQPRPAGRQRRRARPRPRRRAAPRRPRPAARHHHVRQLRAADDRPLPPAPRPA